MPACGGPKQILGTQTMAGKVDIHSDRTQKQLKKASKAKLLGHDKQQKGKI